jgi:propionate CoA-transferase
MPWPSRECSSGSSSARTHPARAPPPPAIVTLIASDQVEAYNLPSGMLFQLHHESAGKRHGLLTEVGLGTFVDPRQRGERPNARTREDIRRLVELDGREMLFLPSIPLDVAIIRSTTADEDGNLTMEHEPACLGGGDPGAGGP